MTRKITFDFDEFEKFIDDLDGYEMGYCGENIYIEYRLLDSGEVQTRKNNIVKNLTMWHTVEDLKGEVEE